MRLKNWNSSAGSDEGSVPNLKMAHASAVLAVALSTVLKSCLPLRSRARGGAEPRKRRLAARACAKYRRLNASLLKDAPRG